MLLEVNYMYRLAIDLLWFFSCLDFFVVCNDSNLWSIKYVGSNGKGVSYDMLCFYEISVGLMKIVSMFAFVSSRWLFGVDGLMRHYSCT